MDANETRFHLVLGRDWLDVRDGVGRKVPRTPDDDSDLLYEEDALQLNRDVLLVRAAPGDTPASLDARTGAIRDRLGNTYVVDGSSIRLRVCTATGGAGEDVFWTDGTGAALRGLAITTDDMLVTGRPGALLIFDLQAGGAPRSVAGPAGFDPFDLAATGTDVLVLDRAARVLYRLALRVPPAALPAPMEQPLFAPCGPGPTTELSASLDAVVSLADDPIAVDALPDGDAVVLYRAAGGGGLRCFRGATPRPGIAFADLNVSPPTVPVGHDLVVVTPADGATRLYVVDAGGNQAFSFHYVRPAPEQDFALQHRAELVLLRGYLGRDLVAHAGDAWYATASRWVPLVVMARPRPRAEGTAVLPVYEEGGVEVPGWDSGRPGCVWHRVLLDGCFPPGSSVRVYSRASDDRALFDDPDAGWRREPPLYKRPDGSELPFDTRGVETREVLLQAATGRYLQLRLLLASDLRATPRIEALRVYFPRFSYLDHYLPAAWREDPVSADFVARFLANPEGVFTTIEDRVAAAQRLFDADQVDPEFLPWLASWFDAELDAAWSEEKRRFFLRNAMEFFRWRGTAKGILAMLRLMIEDCPSPALFVPTPDGPRIVEKFLYRPRIGVLPAELAGGASDPAVRWVPEFGGAALHARWQAFDADPDPDVTRHPTGAFPPSRPTTDGAAWDEFCMAQLGFLPGATAQDLPFFLDYLRRRHGAAVATAWPTLPSATTGPLFTALPPDGPQLVDWFRFESLVRPLRAHAHRFVVVLPTPPRETVAADPGYAERLRSVARQVVEREKPAHTTFDVVYAEHVFRPGEVRLGFDTVVAAPDRPGAPALLLDRDALGEARLAAPFPGRPVDPDGAFLAPVPLPPESP